MKVFLQADRLSKLNMAGNLLIKPFINTFAMAAAFDNLVGWDTGNSGLPNFSLPGLILGSVVAILSAFGDTLAHLSLNIHHQDDYLLNRDQELGDFKLLNAVVPMTYSDLPCESKESKKICGIKSKHLVIAGDFLLHTFDVISPLTIAYHVLRPSSSGVWQNRGVQFLIFLLSCGSAFAETRTCKHHLDKDDHDHGHNHNHGHGHGHDDVSQHAPHQGTQADCWTKLSACIEFITIFLNNLNFVGLLIDNRDDEDELNHISNLALGIGITWSIIISGVTAYNHFRVNRNNQNRAAIHSVSHLPQSQLSRCVRSSVRIWDTASHAIERASPLFSTIKLLGLSENLGVTLGVAFGTLFGSTLVGLADARTCAKNMMG